MRTPSRRTKLLAPAAALMTLVFRGAPAAARYDVRWILLHEPSAAVEQSAREFARRVEKESAGELRVELLTRARFESLTKAPRPLGHLGALRAVREGRAEMCEAYTGSLGRQARLLWALGIPYLFRDFAEADAVIDGPIGPRLLEAPLPLGLRGLALTYAGFAVLATVGPPARRAEGFRALRLQVANDPDALAVARKLGAEPVVVSPEGFLPLAQAGLVDAVETTLADFEERGFDRAAKSITLTEHALTTTMIVVNEPFFQGLPPRLQEILRQAAVEAGRAERGRIARAGSEARRKLAARGVALLELGADEKAQFKDSIPIFKEVGAALGIDGQDLLEEIRRTRPRAP